MGFISNVVNTIVDTVTSGSGDASSTAQNVEDHASDAADAVADAANDPAGTIGLLWGNASQGASDAAHNTADHVAQGVVRWIGGSLDDLTPPEDLSLKSIFGLTLDVLALTEQTIEHKAQRMVGNGPIDLAHAGWAETKKLITAGPAVVWGDVKTTLTDLRDKARGYGERNGLPAVQRLADDAQQLAGAYAKGGPALLWATLRAMLGGSGHHKGGPAGSNSGPPSQGRTLNPAQLRELARLADEQSSEMIDHLRMVQLILQDAYTRQAPPGSLKPSEVHLFRFSRSPQGAQIKHLHENIQRLFSPAPAGPGTLDPAAKLMLGGQSKHHLRLLADSALQASQACAQLALATAIIKAAARGSRPR